MTEQIVHQARKMKDKGEPSSSSKSAMTSRRSSQSKPKPECYHCGHRGHIKRLCWDLNGEKEGQKKTLQKAAVTQENSDSSSKDSEALVFIADQALSVASLNKQFNWTIDSGATSRLSYDKKLFTAI